VENSENFGQNVAMTENGRKFIEKKIIEIEDELGIVLSFKDKGGDSSKESADKEKSHAETIKLLNIKLDQLKKLRVIPVVKIREQNHTCELGNGVKLEINDEHVYAVIDGVCVCKHHLPDGVRIIGSNSQLGKAIMGKKTGEKGTYHSNGFTFNYEIKKIDLPKEAHWVFSYDKPIAEIIPTEVPVLSTIN